MSQRREVPSPLVRRQVWPDGLDRGGFHDCRGMSCIRAPSTQTPTQRPQTQTSTLSDGWAVRTVLKQVEGHSGLGPEHASVRNGSTVMPACAPRNHPRRDTRYLPLLEPLLPASLPAGKGPADRQEPQSSPPVGHPTTGTAGCQLRHRYVLSGRAGEPPAPGAAHDPSLSDSHGHLGSGSSLAAGLSRPPGPGWPLDRTDRGAGQAVGRGQGEDQEDPQTARQRLLVHGGLERVHRPPQ